MMVLIRFWRSLTRKDSVKSSVAEPEPPLLGWSRIKAAPAPAASFWQEKKGNPCVTKHDLKQFITLNVIPKRLALIIHF